ncbi:MAG: hypothetical protein AAGU74_08375 [Bacillota bacterium]
MTNNDFTLTRLAADREIINAATPGPWGITGKTIWKQLSIGRLKIASATDQSDAALIACACNNYGAALDEIERLQTRLERSVELPCKVDSEVWFADRYEPIYDRVVRGVVDGYLWFRSCGFALNVVWDRGIMGHFSYCRKEMPFRDLGKTWFLTREAAEAALKGEPHAG